VIKRLLPQIAVAVIGAMGVIGVSGVSSRLAARRPPSVIDSTSALAVAQAQLADTRRELDRAHQVLEFSGLYGIPADLSAQIYDNAVDAGIPPAIGFQLVKIESDFRNDAESDAYAIGLTQVRLPTARIYDPTVSASDLMNPSVNLQVGFHYLRDLLNRFDHSVPLALEAYNKGPTLVQTQMDLGTDVRGWYSRAIIAGARKGS
jgi:soluble lytic murein transglycosylase-like protein